MLGTGGIDVWWAGISAGFAAIVVGFVVWLRKFAQWTLHKLKEGYKGWFAEAIDEHVQPQFEAIKANTVARANEIKTYTDTNVSQVTEALKVHTQEEGEVVRKVVREELEPLSSKLTEVSDTVAEHMTRDDTRFDEAAKALEAGQSILVEELKKLRDQ